jgi:Golgi nucleoside diphosphatase
MGWLTTSIVGKALSSIIVIVTAILTVSIVGASEDFDSRYAIVVDAGSTGTRAFVFHKVGVDNVTDVIRGYPCGKERSGLSSFSTNHSAVEHLFTSLLQTAASIIPAQFHSSTAVYVRGTAGMRLLELPDQDALWDSTVRMLKKSTDVPFLIDRKNFGTITGHQEAFYAVLASNYIAGSIDGQLRYVLVCTIVVFLHCVTVLILLSDWCPARR